MSDTIPGIDLASQTGQQIIANAINNMSNLLTYNGNNIIRAIVTLDDEDWIGNDPYTQGININNVPINSNSKIDLQPDTTVINQLIDDGVKGLYIQNNNGSLTAYAIGAQPTESLSIQCTISNINQFLVGILIDSMPTKVIYDVGDDLDLTGLVILASYADGSTDDITSDCIFDPVDGSELSDAGEQIIGIAYYKDGITKLTAFSITVNALE